MCIVINCCPVCDIIDLEINHNLQAVFYVTKMFGQKCKYSKKENDFFINFKGPSLKKIKIFKEINLKSESQLPKKLCYLFH